MKMIIRELTEKIDGINRVIKELHTLPQDVCEDAEDYLNEYVEMLLDMKVDI